MGGCATATRRALPASPRWAKDSKLHNTLAAHAGTGPSSSKMTGALSAKNKPWKSPLSDQQPRPPPGLSRQVRALAEKAAGQIVGHGDPDEDHEPQASAHDGELRQPTRVVDLHEEEHHQGRRPTA